MFVLLFKENIAPAMQDDPNSLYQRPRSFSTVTTRVSRTLSFIGHHSDSSSDEDDDKKETTTNEIEEKSIGLSGKDIGYSVSYDKTVEDFSFTSTREQAQK
ncbi:unnamed protein product [Rotaria sordida]|uniref:Uncharacterized protein n=1 Tax=Rotaria sordida TaxID=392033 RepID=A0A815NBS1_9BILA|nr:unnamed protein product [Rotaria sordida]CAF1262022.1 unnamed protein product [Rotaria sordida]CAF1431791.1 unnamed protein product [Rotaria sordida]CAF1435626.1 unnamed protein product [Rotaria sordida]